MMPDINWIQIGAALLGGGAMGAIISSVVTSVRNRFQPIGNRVDTLSVFRQKLGESSLKTEITISVKDSEYKFNNLFLIDIQIVNKGNKDINEFPFGITLFNDDKAVFIESISKDRHHQIDHQTEVSPDKPKSEIDFILKPFNRRDSYSFKLYVVVPERKDEPSPVKISSSQPVKFVGMPTIGEMISEASRSTSLNIGPLKISTRLK